MPRLVSLDQAVRHLRLPIATPVPDPPSDDLAIDLADKLTQAEAIILDYLKPQDPPIDYTGNAIVAAMILIELGELWRFRGDDPTGQGSEQDPERGQLNPTITNLARRLRSPTLA